MANILDYLQWRGDLSFSASPFNDVDNLILALLSYPDYSQTVPGTWEHGVPLYLAADRYFARHPRKKHGLGMLVSDQIQDLLQAAAQSPRFAGAVLRRHVNHVDTALETQFSATCFTLSNGCTYVSYRGTDDTIAGWKEDFNMAVMTPVPAQQAAAAYLEQVAADCGGSLFLGGHSKGGNLAVYAAAHVDEAITQRLRKVWSNDGPGFFPEELNRLEYLLVRDKICTVLPKASLVGRLLCSDSSTLIVESPAAGPLQHDGMNWQVLGTQFVAAPGQTRGSRQAEQSLEAMVWAMPLEERKKLVAGMFEAIDSLGVETLTQLVEDSRKLQSFRAIYAGLASFDKSTRETLLRVLLSLLQQDESFFRRIISP